MRLFQATSISVDWQASAGVMWTGRSSSFPLWNTARVLGDNARKAAKHHAANVLPFIRRAGAVQLHLLLDALKAPGTGERP
jgi:hypothetical protein